MQIIPSTWTFKKKRYSDGSVHKIKACLCARGDPQIEEVYLFGTFEPLINWNTVCIMLILSTILGLSTKQVNYTTYFVHTTIDNNPEWASL